MIPFASSSTCRRPFPAAMAALGVVAVAAVAAGDCTAAPDALVPPNIVLVYVDDMGWRDVGVQGSEYYRTPHIDAFASRAVRFTNAYANAPNCAPSRAALLSGMYGPRTGIYTVETAARGPSALRALMPVENRTELALDVVTVAEALQAGGYRTGHVGKWHLGGWGHQAVDQGFDWSVAGDSTGTPASYFFPYRSEGPGGRSIPGLDGGEEGEYLPDRLTDEAIRFIESSGDGPFFLYLSHYSVHTPIRARPEIVARYEGEPAVGGQGNPVYAAMIESVDTGFGRLLDRLDSLGIADRTVVIFYSDNGGFGPVTSMAPLRGSKGMLYEGGIREPLLVRWPGHTEAGSVVDVPVIGTDFYPTFLEIAGVDVPAGVSLDGLSLVPVLEGGGAISGGLVDRPLFWHFPAYLGADASTVGPWRTTPASAVRRGRYKLIHFFEGDRWELYDLTADVSESRDLSSAEPVVMAELRNTLETWWDDSGAFRPTEANPEFDPVLRARAEAAGAEVRRSRQ